MTYPLQNQPGHPGNDAQAPKQGAQRVIDSVREFAKPEYGVNLFKLESPLAGASLPAPDGLSGHQAAQEWFNEMGCICRDAGVPGVLLSAGVTPEQFVRVMQYAYAAGANGFLAGQAIWWEALQHFPDLAACRESLRTQGLQTMKILADLTRQVGHA